MSKYVSQYLPKVLCALVNEYHQAYAVCDVFSEFTADYALGLQEYAFDTWYNYGELVDTPFRPGLFRQEVYYHPTREVIVFCRYQIDFICGLDFQGPADLFPKQVTIRLQHTERLYDIVPATYGYKLISHDALKQPFRLFMFAIFMGPIHYVFDQPLDLNVRMYQVGTVFHHGIRIQREECWRIPSLRMDQLCSIMYVDEGAQHDYCRA